MSYPCLKFHEQKYQEEMQAKNNRKSLYGNPEAYAEWIYNVALSENKSLEKSIQKKWATHARDVYLATVHDDSNAQLDQVPRRKTPRKIKDHVLEFFRKNQNIAVSARTLFDETKCSESFDSFRNSLATMKRDKLIEMIAFPNRSQNDRYRYRLANFNSESEINQP